MNRMEINEQYLYDSLLSLSRALENSMRTIKYLEERCDGLQENLSYISSLLNEERAKNKCALCNTKSDE